MPIKIKRPHPDHYSQHRVGEAGPAHDDDGQERASALCKDSVNISAGTAAKGMGLPGASLCAMPSLALLCKHGH